MYGTKNGGNYLTYYSYIIAIVWITLAILTVLVFENDRFSRKTKRWYFEVYIIVALSALFEWLGVLIDGNTDYPTWLLQVVKCGDYILTPFACVALLIQLRNRKVYSIIVFSILMANTIFQIVTAFTGGMITIDSLNHYTHGPLYPIYMIVYFLLIILVIIGFIDYGRRFRKQNVLSIYSIMLFIIVGILMQEFSGPEIRTAYLSIAIGLALLFIHMSELSQTVTDDELKQKDYEIMVSQIKPHFLFNSLAVIREIYQEDLDAGDQAITDFSQFLRYNLDALNKQRMIPFADEIENVRRYLDLQQLRFGDSLQVTYNLECTNFLVPTFSIQPMVENAVSHGARKRTDRRGQITIQTKEYEDHYEVSIIDNGPGFNPNKIPKYEDRAHVGIENVIERLELAQCGKLVIDSVKGEGTTVKLIINKGAKA